MLSLLYGCAYPVHKDYVAISGSRADATITLGYRWNPSAGEYPEVDIQQGIELAKKRCKQFGYNSAEAFDGETSGCTKISLDGICCEMTATLLYQCINK